MDPKEVAFRVCVIPLPGHAGERVFGQADLAARGEDALFRCVISIRPDRADKALHHLLAVDDEREGMAQALGGAAAEQHAAEEDLKVL